MNRESIQSASRKHKNTHIGFITLILFLFVMITGIIVFSMFVYPSSTVRSDKMICITANAPLFELQTQASKNIVSEEEIHSAPFGEITIEDNTKIWHSNTQVDIFEHNDIRVQSDGTGNANHVIAPGTSNDYTFSLQNDINYAVKYTLEISGGNDSEYKIPVQVQILGSDGSSLTGDDWTSISELNDIFETDRLNPNTDKQYIIRWKWAFENATDDYDTFLGNQAVAEEIACHININVISEYDYDNPDYIDPDNPYSSDPTPVITGDNSNVIIYIIFSVGAFFIVLLILLTKKDKSRKFK